MAHRRLIATLALAIAIAGCSEESERAEEDDGIDTDAGADSDPDTDSDSARDSDSDSGTVSDSDVDSCTGTIGGSDPASWDCAEYWFECLCPAGEAFGDQECSCAFDVLSAFPTSCIANLGCGADAKVSCLDRQRDDVEPGPEADDAILACQSVCGAPNDFCEKLGVLNADYLAANADCQGLADCDAMKACYEAADTCEWDWFWPWVWE